MAGEVYQDKSTAMINSSSSGRLICFSSSSNNQNQIQDFESNPVEIFNNTNMDHHHQMNIGFSKTPVESHSAAVTWKNPSSSSKTTTNHDFYHDFPESSDHHHNNNLIDDSNPSLRSSCVFPCEGNERPSQGLSLSLSSTNPSSIGLQSFELIRQDGFLLEPSSNFQHGFHQIRNSKYLCPVQDLLNEFCSLGQSDLNPKLQQKSNNKQLWEEEDENSNSRNRLSSLEFVELQKRKTKLLSMLEEVDRRYRHYCNQMKAVVSSFEAVAGNGAASIYSSLASKAMSRYFRCLRDGIVAQIKETRTTMGEKDPIAPGTTKGETPRLRALDQALRQQLAFQQMSMMESHPWRPQRGLPERSVSVLRAWLFEHFLHPYPSDVDKHILARQTGLSRSQVSNWFINARVRLWKPMVEEMYLEETKDHETNYLPTSTSDEFTDIEDRPPLLPPHLADQKPTHHQLIRMDSECLSSIINNNPDKISTIHDPSKSTKTLMQQCFGSFGSMDLDFSNSYNQTAYANDQTTFHGGGSGGGGSGVSLTLGLQQHGGNNNGVSLASQSSLFYTRDHMEDCQPVQYSLLDHGDQPQNLPYRNLMGAQLLHDLAG